MVKCDDMRSNLAGLIQKIPPHIATYRTAAKYSKMRLYFFCAIFFLNKCRNLILFKPYCVIICHIINWRHKFIMFFTSQEKRLFKTCFEKNGVITKFKRFIKRLKKAKYFKRFFSTQIYFFGFKKL